MVCPSTQLSSSQECELRMSFNRRQAPRHWLRCLRSRRCKNRRRRGSKSRLQVRIHNVKVNNILKRSADKSMAHRCMRTRTNAALQSANLASRGQKSSRVRDNHVNKIIRILTYGELASKISSKHRGHGYDTVTKGVDESLQKWGLGVFSQYSSVRLYTS